MTTKANFLYQLQNDLRNVNPIKRSCNNKELDAALGPIRFSFPGSTFPVGATHEFICENAEAFAPTSGFVLGLLSRLIGQTGISIWISAARTIFPPGLSQFGIDPANLIFIDSKNDKEVAWMLEEALKCDAVSAVIGEIKQLDFTTSRRFQLAVEKNNVTGLLLWHRRKPATTASVCRWQISSLPSIVRDGLPGVGFPRWCVELLKVRNGRAGKWNLEFNAGGFYHDPKVEMPEVLQKRKAV